MFDPVGNPTGFVITMLVITGVIIVASFVWRSKWSAGLATGGMKDGIPATAVILGMGQTGMYINNLPQMTFELQVQPSTGGAPYQASVRQTVPHMAFGMLAPGRTVAVVVSPKDPSKVKLDLQGTANIGQIAAMPGVVAAGSPAAGFAAAGGVPGAVGAMPANVTSNADLLARGTRTWVTIVSVQDTGQLYQGIDPILLMGVHVHREGAEYRSDANAYRVPAAVRPRLQAGVQLQGAFDPANPMSVALDWDTIR